MPKDRKDRYVPMTICLSSKCDRGCRHCDAQANMEGCFFTIEQARELALNATKYAEQAREKEGIDCCFSFVITGDGESLLNPDLPEIIRILFSECPTSQIGLVTSGINPKNPEEEEKFLEILQQPFANQLVFSLSFNIFQSGFPKRLLRTMKLLYKNGVDHIDIKIVLTHKHVYKTIHRLNRLINGYFLPLVKKVNPLANKENAFSPVDLRKDLEHKIKELPHHKAVFTSGNEPQQLTESLTKIRPLTEWELGEWFVFYQTNFSETYQFEATFGTKTFSYKPQHLVNRGRAKNLTAYLMPFQNHLRPCRFLIKEEYTRIHLGADGYYYPSCDCPKSTALRIGHVGDDIHDVIKRFFYLKHLLLGYMLSEKRWYDDICDHCVWVMSKARRIGILGNIGINCPQEDGPSRIALR